MLTGKEDKIKVTPDDLKKHWSGRIFILWKNFHNIKGSIPFNSSGESITALKMLLRDIGYQDIDISPDYDDHTRNVIMEIQKK
ncbi:MAG: hypothetical protein IME96_05150 [Proteobacteria bacterium]|nr:hypothetical protein [Pseudomonadota bacterium]